MNLAAKPTLGVQLGTMLNFVHADPSMYGRVVRGVNTDVFAAGGIQPISDVPSSTTDAAVTAQFKRSVIARARPHLDRVTEESAEVLRRTGSLRDVGFIKARDLRDLVMESMQNDIISRGPALSMAQSGFEVFQDSTFEGMLGELGVAHAVEGVNDVQPKDPPRVDRIPHRSMRIEHMFLLGAVGAFVPSFVLNRFITEGEGISFLSQLETVGFYAGCIGTGLALTIIGIKRMMRIGF